MYCITAYATAQDAVDSTQAKTDTAETPVPLPPPVNVFKPIIGLGVGMFAYYGDFSKPYKSNQPVISRV
ncbi:MAG: hypothetical protein ACE5DN_03535, partial [Flavobacteriales bacterium]